MELTRTDTEQLVADSRLLWLAEAYAPSLAVYGVAKVAAKKDASLTGVVSAVRCRSPYAFPCSGFSFSARLPIAAT